MTEPPVDPDLDPSGALDLPVLLAIALGGALGAAARYEAGLRWPTAAGTFPWTTLWVNTLGCALIGVLLVGVTEVVQPHRLIRPLLGTGVLGGFTTFSTYAVDSSRLLATGHPGTALADVGATVVAALTAVLLATRLTRRLLVRR